MDTELTTCSACLCTDCVENERKNFDDVEEILDCIYKYFVMREPLCACVNLIKDPSERIELLDRYLKMTVMENMTIIAKDHQTSDKIVGKL